VREPLSTVRIGPAIEACLGADRPARLGVAVSGGSDSTALLILLADWARDAGIALHAATVDHGLRPEAADEARAVAALCARLGVPHATLAWGGKPDGNVQDAARRARYRLLGHWAHEAGLAAVALGHTMDDQAETLLLRLERGSGVDGLSGMAPATERDGIRWLRPLLGQRRAALRATLVARGIGWAEDPSNDDPSYGRIRMRRALAETGLSVERLAETAARMASARAFLERETAAAAERLATVTPAGSVLLDAAGLRALPLELRHRLFAHAVKWVSASRYRPRLDALERTLEAAFGGTKSTLAGCLVAPVRNRIAVIREPAAAGRAGPPEDGIWDKRWRVDAPPGTTTAALGDAGLAAIPDWRDRGHLRDELRALPGFFRSGILVAQPLLGFGEPAAARLRHPADHFFASAITH
jgi:tRNA(Ile)-lysidine synthase